MPHTHRTITLIFDFDGTLANSLERAIKVINDLSVIYDFRSIQAEELPMLRQKSALEIVRYLQIPLLKVPRITQKARQAMSRELHLIRPIDGIPIVLHTLKSRGRQLGLLSSNSLQNLSSFNRQHHLQVFDFISAASPLWGKSHSLKRLLRERQLNPKNLILVGDELRDIEAARQAGVKVAAVSWGYNTHAALEEAKPDWLLEHPKQLLKL